MREVASFPSRGSLFLQGWVGEMKEEEEEGGGGGRGGEDLPFHNHILVDFIRPIHQHSIRHLTQQGGSHTSI